MSEVTATPSSPDAGLDRGSGPDDERPWRLLMAGILAVFVPFLVRPPHIDDHLFLLAAQQIRQSPLDPFGIGINWFGWVQPLQDAQMNPPGLSYLFAVVEPLGGLPGLHLVVMATAMLLLWGVRELARDLGASPLLATAGAVITPAVFISSTTLMCDVPMVAAWVWAMVLWRRGLKHESARLLWAAALVACVSFAMKYFGVTLFFMFVGSAVVDRAPLRRWVLPVLLLPAFIVASESAMVAVYGAPHFLRASGYAADMRRSSEGLDAALGAFGYLGGSMIGLAAWAPFILSRRAWVVVVGLTVLVAGLLWQLQTYTWISLQGETGFRWSFFVQAVIQSAAMAAILLSVGTALARRWREADSLVMVAWMGGTAVFALAVNWTLAVRSILPLVIPVAVLMARELGPRVRRAHLLALVPGAVFTFLGADGDAKMANAQVEAAEAALKLAPAERLWFRGHWGFQTAMERGGATPLDVDESPVRTGDVIVWPSISTGTVPDLSPRLVEPLPEIDIPIASWFTTLQGGGFYTIDTGPWPILVRDIPPLHLRAFKVIQGRVEER